ncbi:MAG: uroporphyrinogen-III C-methyltransferase [Cyclobacteriaceae bacterium]
MGKVYIVGAGPGDVDLITVKGKKLLASADVVLYDALANEALMDECKPDCRKVYVGKKSGLHQYQQIYINDMLVDFAKQNEVVVRLKGGDPYVFGRGHEELAYLSERNIDGEVVPGISSSIAVPGAVGIPLTKRGVNESFWVTTGTTMNGEFSKDLELAAQSSATVIVLMGMKNLGKIVSLFAQYRGGEEPIGIIQQGTTENQKEGYGRLSDMLHIVSDQQLTSPAIIVIGKVVNERNAIREKVSQLSQGGL